jgi:hypothetical protein
VSGQLRIDLSQLLPVRVDRPPMAGRGGAARSCRTSAAPGEPTDAQRARIYLDRLPATPRPHLEAGSSAHPAAVQYGPDVLAPLYEETARRIFANADHYRVIRENLESVIIVTLSEVGLHGPAGRRSHEQRLRSPGSSQPQDDRGTQGHRHADHSSRRHRFLRAHAGRRSTGIRSPVAVPGLLAGYHPSFEIRRSLVGSLELGSTEPESSRPGSSGPGALHVGATSARSA